MKEYKFLGVLYFLIALTYLILGVKYKNNGRDPGVVKSHFIFTVGYGLFAMSYLLFSSGHLGGQKIIQS